jgi:hypothetical protein
MAREARSLVHRAEILASVATSGSDHRAVALSEELIEAAWQLMRHLTGPVSASTTRATRPR